MTADDTVTAKLAEWETLANAATDGPWEVGDRYHIQGASHCRCDESYGPLVWEGVRDINGTPMRTHIHRRPQPFGNGEDTSIYGGALPELVVVALSTSEYVRISPADAEFIAAARAAMPALLGFVREVREGHEPMDWCPNPRHDAEGVCPECVVTCVKDGLEWPCPTEQAARKWLGGEG